MSGFQRRDSFLILTAMYVLPLISTLFYLPRNHVKEAFKDKTENVEVNVVNTAEEHTTSENGKY